MYVGMHACMYVGMHASHIHTCMHAYLHTCMHTPITGSVTSNPFNSLIRSTCLRKISTLNSKPQLAEIQKRAKQKAAAQLQAAHPHRLHVCRNPFNSLIRSTLSNTDYAAEVEEWETRGGMHVALY